MTDEERQRAMEFIVAQEAKNSGEIEKLLESQRLRGSMAARQPSEKVIEARRKLNRDMDRLERVLNRIVEAKPRDRQRNLEEDKRWREFEKQSRERSTKISAFAAASDQKLKALIDHIKNDRAKRDS